MGAASCGEARRRYDVIQASLVDTWAATAAGAYTLTENSSTRPKRSASTSTISPTRLADDHALGVRRSAPGVARPGGLRRPRLDASKHLAIVRYDRVATFLLKKTAVHRRRGRAAARSPTTSEFTILYAPGIESDPISADPWRWCAAGTSAADYRRLILAGDREQFLADYPLDIARRPTTGRSSFTRRGSPTSSTWHSARRCSSATA